MVIVVTVEGVVWVVEPVAVEVLVADTGVSVSVHRLSGISDGIQVREAGSHTVFLTPVVEVQEYVTIVPAVLEL